VHTCLNIIQYLQGQAPVKFSKQETSGRTGQSGLSESKFHTSVVNEKYWKNYWKLQKRGKTGQFRSDKYV